MVKNDEVDMWKRNYRFPSLFKDVTYVPFKSRTANTKTSILGLIYAKNNSFPSLFAVFGGFLSPRILKPPIAR